MSAASIWEISIKSAMGKLTANPAEVLAAIEPAGFSLLPITGEHAAKLAELPLLHQDDAKVVLCLGPQLRMTAIPTPKRS